MAEIMDVKQLILGTYIPLETQRVQKELDKGPNGQLRVLMFALKEIVHSPIQYSVWSGELQAGEKTVRLFDVVPALGDLGLVDYSLDDQADDFMGIQATAAGKAVCEKLKQRGFYD